jgi:pimeloyl-ACP methyl ester carboxylesterase
MFIPYNAAKLYTVAFGHSSRTLLGLGGWAGSWELWTEPFTYLSETWRTVAYDHRGTGATTAPVDTITFEALVDDIFAILDALDIERCVLAAESAGVIVALQAALRQPGRFQGLVLVDGMYYRPKSAKPDPFLLGLQNDFSSTIDWFVDACVPEPDSDAIRHWGRQILARSPQSAAIRLYECLVGLDLRPQVSLITQPTLILHGAADVIAPVEDSRWLAAQISRSQLQIFEGTGHVPTVTRPREVSEAINGYFAQLE